jgi:hypothetical protein
MNIVARRWRFRAFGILLLAGLSGCVATGVGYVGGVYEPSGYDDGRWGHGYHVAPPRRGERRPERPTPPAYKPAPRERAAPSIPTRRRER